MKTMTRAEIEALNLLNLVKDHKEHCNNSECNVSLSLIKPIYERLVQRKVTDEENAYFM